MRRWWPETLLLVVLALAAFLGCLGSVELWGKREQRAAAEAIDTVDHNHWLVAQIQGRPRLEKPPLPRWSIAVLMKITGCRDEWIVRLPGAVAGALTVALIYALGLRMGGRELARSSALVLCSSAFFVGEMRQASNDGPLALFTTLALYAAWRRLEASGETTHRRADRPGGTSSHTGRRLRSGALLFYCALGLGFLTKGPVILLLVGRDARPLPAIGRPSGMGAAPTCLRLGLLIFAALAVELAGRRLAGGPGGRAGLGPGDVGEDRVLADPGASPAPAAGGAMAGHGPSLDPHRPGGGDPAVPSDEKRTSAPPPAASADARSASRHSSGSPGGGAWATWLFSASGRSPSPTITCRVCRAWPC